MPFPVVAHQGLAAPALLVQRWRLDGVALLAGTMAPDLTYALDRSRFDLDAGSHDLPALVWLCIPVAVVTGWTFRSVVARPLAAHIPDLGPLRLKDVAWAESDWHPFATTALSAMLGGLTHLVADGFTHPEPWATDLLPRLTHPVDAGFLGPGYRSTYWYDVVGAAATTVGVVTVVACLVVAARRRNRQGVPRPTLAPATPRSVRRLWGTTAVGVLAGLAAAARVWGPETRAQGTMLAMLLVAAALTVGCAWADAPGPSARGRSPVVRSAGRFVRCGNEPEAPSEATAP